MASFTSRLAGWAAGRLKGEKARKKTMEFVDKTGVGQALGFLGDAALLGGAGKLAGMGARAAGLTKAASAAPAAQAAMTPMTRVSGINIPLPTDVSALTQPMSITDRLARGARGVGSYIAKKPEVAGQALTAYAGSRQAAANRELQREQLKQRESEFEREYGLRRGQDERELERQRRIAQMLAPLFQQISGGQR